jgi:type II secretory pathway component PulF
LSEVGSLVIGLLSAAAACMPLVIIAAVVPKFTEIFRDFGVALSGLSLMLIRLGNALASITGIGLILLLAVVIAAAVGLAWRTHRAVGLALLLLFCGWFLLSIGIILLGLMLPLVAMIESLQKGGAV